MTTSTMLPIQEGELQLPKNPVEAVLRWLEDAKQAGLPEPTSMTLATATGDGFPSARIVLFKGCSQSPAGREGFEFFTNYESRKSQQLKENPRAALVFHWVALRRQIRIEGAIEQLSADESNRYFQSRPRDSQIGAWSSPQSKHIQSRQELIELVEKNRVKFGTGPVPCPPFWGGWRLVPKRIEFWEERPFRLHERHECLFENGAWVYKRLAP
ncbi:MAG: pyridoxamine 5'-phosphate oxidase [Bdellovibrionales bacterium]|nr:pyridoxamine 5'-phosphate oxidase [Bdellovibrionales bacterium]